MKILRLVLSLVLPPAARAGVERAVIAGREIAAWRPAGPAPAAGYPLVLFSHGFAGTSTQSIFLMEALAGSGYLVLAPKHRDAQKGGTWYPGKIVVEILLHPPQVPFGRPDQWSEATYRDRADDLEAVLDALLRAGDWNGLRIDPARIGIAGHSLGGYTVLGLAGAWPGWKDRRIRAVLALSPYLVPYLVKRSLGHIGVPVMYQGGTKDRRVTPWLRREGGGYDETGPPKYYVEFAGAGHMAWTNLETDWRDRITAYGVAFFNRYLRGDPSPADLAVLEGRDRPQGVSQFKSDQS